jgi:hypothetical protein
MNIIRNIEGATLLTIGAFCAAAVTSIVLHGAHVLPTQQVAVNDNVIALPTVVVVGKRMTAAEKSQYAQSPVAG